MTAATSPVARARSFLFVPATRPERFAKAYASGADCVIVDLEDAVAPDQKVLARETLMEGLQGFERALLARTIVRINGIGSAWHAEDVRAVAKLVTHGLAGPMVPKAESASDLRQIGVAMGPDARLVPLIESLEGLDKVDTIALTPQVLRLAFGHLDFQLDLGMRCLPDEDELSVVRFALVAASRRARLSLPVDGVTADVGNGEQLEFDVRRARAFGFGGKLCIHPAQVDKANAVLSPSPVELDWARRVVAESGRRKGQVFSLDGRMVDLPVVRQAERTLQLLGVEG